MEFLILDHCEGPIPMELTMGSIIATTMVLKIRYNLFCLTYMESTRDGFFLSCLPFSMFFSYSWLTLSIPGAYTCSSCANKDLDGYLGPLSKFIKYCRIVALLPVIPYTQRNNW
jgi:hypothetical protein